MKRNLFTVHRRLKFAFYDDSEQTTLGEPVQEDLTNTLRAEQWSHRPRLPGIKLAWDTKNALTTIG